MSEETEDQGYEIDPGVAVGNLPAAMIDVINERRRQILVEGFTPAQDDAAYACGALGRAAACYARGAQFLEPHKMGDGNGKLVDVPVQWPLAPTWWKPRSRREDLVRAGALILAEIERLDRAAGEADHG